MLTRTKSHHCKRHHQFVEALPVEDATWVLLDLKLRCVWEDVLGAMGRGGASACESRAAYLGDRNRHKSANHPKTCGQVVTCQAASLLLGCKTTKDAAALLETLSMKQAAVLLVEMHRRCGSPGSFEEEDHGGCHDGLGGVGPVMDRVSAAGLAATLSHVEDVERRAKLLLCLSKGDEQQQGGEDHDLDNDDEQQQGGHEEQDNNMGDDSVRTASGARRLSSRSQSPGRQGLQGGSMSAASRALATVEAKRKAKARAAKRKKRKAANRLGPVLKFMSPEAQVEVLGGMSSQVDRETCAACLDAVRTGDGDYIGGGAIGNGSVGAGGAGDDDDDVADALLRNVESSHPILLHSASLVGALEELEAGGGGGHGGVGHGGSRNSGRQFQQQRLGFLKRRRMERKRKAEEPVVTKRFEMDLKHMPRSIGGVESSDDEEDDENGDEQDLDDDDDGNRSVESDGSDESYGDGGDDVEGGGKRRGNENKKKNKRGSLNTSPKREKEKEQEPTGTFAPNAMVTLLKFKASSGGGGGGGSGSGFYDRDGEKVAKKVVVENEASWDTELWDKTTGHRIVFLFALVTKMSDEGDVKLAKLCARLDAAKLHHW